MDDLDDLLDDIEDSPVKKTKVKSKNTYIAKKDSVDDFDDMLNDVLGPESSYSKKPKAKAKSSNIYSTELENDDFPTFNEEKKVSADDGWGDNSGGTGSYQQTSSGYAPKKPKKGDK